MASRKYDDLSKEELVRLLQARDLRDATRFGLVWEANEIERDKALNADFVALDLDETLSCGPKDGPWKNLIIEGDNFDALRYLRMTFAGRVKCIYIDPPYNTGNSDFVYNDKYVNKDDLWRHSTWCEFMYQRLVIAKDLLTDNGAIFVSIDDNEVASLRLLMDRVFGASNFISTLIWEKGKKGDAKLVSVTHEYVLVYAASKSSLMSGGTTWKRRKAGVDAVLAKYDALRSQFGSNHAEIRKAIMQWFRSLAATDPARAHKHYNWSDDRGLYFPDNFAGPDDGRESRPRYDILHPVTGKPCKKPSTGWRWEEPRTIAALSEVPPRIHFGDDETTIPNRKSYLSEIDSEPMQSVFYKDGRAATLEVERLVGKGAFSFPKDTEIISDLVRLCLNGDRDSKGYPETAHPVVCVARIALHGDATD
jgi:adenine-specific DNA-methyltransferase